MMRIPPNLRWTQGNNSDLFGAISASKNVNLDEEGYIKLSSRTISIMNDSIDADFALPLALGRTDEGEFNVVNGDQPFEVSLSETAISVTQDDGSSAPALSPNSDGCWWQNRWYATTSNNLTYKAANGDWTTNLESLSSSYSHPIEVFRNKNTLCIGNGASVIQLNTSHAQSTLAQLTLPTGFEVIGLSYSGYRMGITCKLDSTISGQDQDAYFFTWDGNTSEANQGVPIGSDMSAGLVAYSGTWVTLTRTGQLMQWNGGGFTELDSFPFYFKPVTWGDFTNRVALGRNIVVEGETLLINVDLTMTDYGKLNQSHLPYSPSGVWCFDKNIGLHHKYSPSLSSAYATIVLNAGVNTTTNILTRNTGTIPATGNIAVYSNDQGVVIGGLTLRATYYIIKLSASTFQLATSRENAEAGIAIDLTDTGGTQHAFFMFDLLDYGASHVASAGAIGLMGLQSQLYDHVIFGCELLKHDAAGNRSHLIVSVPGIENRGYFVLSKIQAAQAEDAWKRLFLPFRPLGDDDAIIVKKKLVELHGLPVTTTQDNAGITWTSSSSFYTTADLSAVKTAFDANHEIECELIAGAGAGSLIRVSEIATEDGVYSIVLAEPVLGATSGRVGEAMFDNYAQVLEITGSGEYAPKGYAEVPLDSDSAWVKIKIELRGIETTVAPMLLSNSTKK